MIRLPAHPLPAKPVFGAACNGCGLCCASEVCLVGRMALGMEVKAPCPLLKFHEGRTTCSLVDAEIQHKLEPMIQNTLYIGEGCGMGDYLIEKYKLNDRTKTQTKGQNHESSSEEGDARTGSAQRCPNRVG